MHTLALVFLLFAQTSEVLTSDTPRTTVAGNTFVAPAGWKVSVRDRATILESPEGNSHVALVDVKANDADAALAEAWKQYGVDPKWPIFNKTDLPNREGWTNIRRYDYETSSEEKRTVWAVVRKANDMWTVAILDAADAVAEKRGGQFAVIFGRLLPKGYQRESFAGKTAHKLDAKRIAELTKFVEEGRKKLKIPGVSVGIIEDGKVIFADGFGVRDIRSSTKPDANTLYMIASNTKAMTTLMLAKLVDEGKLTWDTPVTSVLPSFKLGDAETTKRVLVKHLICACTGLPRQDFEWLFQFAGVTPDAAMATLGQMQPTSNFGELFQYSNPLAAAGGYVGGHVAYPTLELGRAYDEAMRTRVLEPLGMKSTTFDFKRALAANHATAHSFDLDSNPKPSVFDLDYSIIPVRPAGGAWSNVNDMLKYVQMELNEGVLPSGKRYITKETLLTRRSPQVAIGKDVTYGMGLMVDTTWGVPVVRHGGDMIGYHSDMMWYPQQKVGAVILTNADTGPILRSAFSRKLLEVMFDGRPQADADVEAQAKRVFESMATFRSKVTYPPDATETAKLASRYTNPALGDIAISRSGSTATLDFGEWKSEIGTYREPDGSVSLVTISPGVNGFTFIPKSGEKRALIIRDAQHEYVFTER